MITGRQVLAKIRNYRRPIKTRHLASRLNVDKSELVQILNKPHIKRRVVWVNLDGVQGWLKKENIPA